MGVGVIVTVVLADGAEPDTMLIPPAWAAISAARMAAAAPIDAVTSGWLSRLLDLLPDLSPDELSATVLPPPLPAERQELMLPYGHYFYTVIR